MILAKSLAVQPSAGCGKTLPESPRPGEYHRFFFIHNDIKLGPVERDFIVQLPKGNLYTFFFLDIWEKWKLDIHMINEKKDVSVVSTILEFNILAIFHIR